MRRVAGDVAQIMYTSGSTGRAKGVVVSHGNVAAGVDAVSGYLGLTSGDRIASVLPFTFDYGLNQLLCATALGGCVVVVGDPRYGRIAQSLHDNAVSVVAGVPSLWLGLLGTDAFASARVETLRVTTNSGGRLPSDGVRRLHGCQPAAKLFLMYGLTEAFRSTYLEPDRVDVKPSSIGTAIPGADVFVVRDDGARCAPGEVGEIVHRGPTVALGYWNDAGATAVVFRSTTEMPAEAQSTERVVHSGDLAYADDDGDLHFVGRRDRMVKTRGHRVSPDEVVEVLHLSGLVSQAMCEGVPHDEWGEAIVAHIVLRPGADAGAVETHARGELPTWMVPARVVVHDRLELNANGKPRTLACREDGS